MEAGECGLTRGTCFAARHLELVAVAGLLWISWCVLGGAEIFVFFFVSIFFSSNAHGLLLQVRGHLASFTSLLVIRKAGRAKPPKLFFAFRQKSLIIPGCVQGAII